MNEALVQPNALVLDTAENEELGKEVSLIESQAMSVEVTSDESYQYAAEITQSVKKAQKQVEEFWEPLRVATKKPYDEVLARKKDMLDPLKKAEKILKDKMGSFYIEKERRRKEQEEKMRRLAQAEVDKKLAEAIEAQNNGDVAGAEFALADAEVMDGIASTGVIPAQATKADGVSTSKSWKITSIDENLVPISLNGAVIRPVDQSAVMALIKASKGKIEIPGVKFEETVTISVRT